MLLLPLLLGFAVAAVALVALWRLLRPRYREGAGRYPGETDAFLVADNGSPLYFGTDDTPATTPCGDDVLDNRIDTTLTGAELSCDTAASSAASDAGSSDSGSDSSGGDSAGGGGGD